MPYVCVWFMSAFATSMCMTFSNFSSSFFFLFHHTEFGGLRSAFIRERRVVSQGMGLDKVAWGDGGRVSLWYHRWVERWNSFRCHYKCYASTRPVKCLPKSFVIMFGFDALSILLSCSVCQSNDGFPWKCMMMYGSAKKVPPCLAKQSFCSSRKLLFL